MITDWRDIDKRMKTMKREDAEHMRQIFRRLMKGTGGPADQKIGMKFILGELCGLADMPAAQGTEREIGIVDGARMVGIVIAEIAGFQHWSQTEEHDDGPSDITSGGESPTTSGSASESTSG